PSPTASTTPHPSHPETRGYSRLSPGTPMPTHRSMWLNALASVRTTASPARGGAGSGQSVRSATFGATGRPCFSTTIALMPAAYPGRRGPARSALRARVPGAEEAGGVEPEGALRQLAGPAEQPGVPQAELPLVAALEHRAEADRARLPAVREFRPREQVDVLRLGRG